MPMQPQRRASHFDWPIVPYAELHGDSIERFIISVAPRLYGDRFSIVRFNDIAWNVHVKPTFMERLTSSHTPMLFQVAVERWLEGYQRGTAPVFMYVEFRDAPYDRHLEFDPQHVAFIQHQCKLLAQATSLSVNLRTGSQSMMQPLDPA